MFFWFWVLGLGLRSPLLYFPYKVNFLAYPVPRYIPPHAETLVQDAAVSVQPSTLTLPCSKHGYRKVFE